jgi:hypothetical protein
MRGAVSVFYVTIPGTELLAQTTPMLEEKSWLGGRLVIRVQDQDRRQAEGFVSVSSFADISRRAGIVGRRLLALLAGTETPADVAAIMRFYEDPKRLADAAPDVTRGGSKDGNASEEPGPIVVVAELSGTYAGKLAPTAGQDWAANRNRSRFMDHIFAAFRERRRPFGRISAGGK